MRNVLRWAGKGFMWLCTIVVVMAALTYVVGKAVGIPVRVTYQTVASATLPQKQQGAQEQRADSSRFFPPAALQAGSTKDRPRPSTTKTSAPANDTTRTPTVRNVIFFVGDGMGLSMLAAVDALAERRLAIPQMPVTGLVRVRSLSSLITDSAAGATAFATGYKTTNGTVAMTPDGTRRQTILEAASQQGFATGVITTSYLTDATPSAFTAHAPSRDNYDALAQQMIASETDVLIGGNQAVFTDSLRRVARQQGFAVADSLKDLPPPPDSARWLGLFSERAGRFDAMHGPPLAQTLEATLEKLKHQGERFFLVVEQEGTDAAGHINRLSNARTYLRELDRAVERALQFAVHDGRTLVIVTADHDTGGLSITQGAYAQGQATARWNSFGHTAAWTPVLAYGPGAQHFTGVQENTRLPLILKRLLGLQKFLAQKTRGEPRP